MLKKITQLVPVIALLAGLVAVALPQTSYAVDNSNDDHKSYICHRTNSAVNPYNLIEVDHSSIDGVGKSDHLGEHDSPVVPTSLENAAALKEQKIEWGDIIQPEEGVTPGLNWTEVGQAIYENGCNYEDEELVADITYGVVCSENGAVVTLTNEGSAEGEVTVNEEVIAVPAGSTVERTYETGEEGLQIVIVIDEETVYDEVVTCEEGEVLGDTDPEVLPNTSGNITAVITAAVASVALIAGLISLAVRSYLTARQ